MSWIHYVMSRFFIIVSTHRAIDMNAKQKIYWITAKHLNAWLQQQKQQQKKLLTWTLQSEFLQFNKLARHI